MQNIAFPLVNENNLIALEKGQLLPQEIIEYAENNKLCLLTEDPLLVIEPLSEDVQKNLSFISNPSEYHNALYYGKQLLCTDETFQKNLDLAMQYGLSLKLRKKVRALPFSKIVRDFDLNKKFAKEFNRIQGKHSNTNKKPCRCIYFRNTKTAPIIKEIDNDIISTFKHLNCPILVIDVAQLQALSEAGDFESIRVIQSKILTQIKVFKPDEAFGYNEVGIFPIGDSHFLETMNIPYNALFFDNPLYFMSKLKHCKDKNLIRIFCLDKYFIAHLKEIGFKQTFYFPIATNRHMTSLKGNTQFSNNILFTSTVKPPGSIEGIIAQVDQEDYISFMRDSWSSITEDEEYRQGFLLEKFKLTLTPERFCDFQKVWFKIDNLGSSELRVKTINALKDFPIDIFGGDFWKKHQLSEKHHYRGYLKYNNLPAASRNAKLTICRSPLNIQNGIQQRIIDCGALGGMVLADYREVLDDHFKIDEELYVYRNCDELQDKVKFLMNNPQAIAKSIKLMHKKVIKEHTWVRRIIEILSLIK